MLVEGVHDPLGNQSVVRRCPEKFVRQREGPEHPGVKGFVEGVRRDDDPALQLDRRLEREDVDQLGIPCPDRFHDRAIGGRRDQRVADAHVLRPHGPPSPEAGPDVEQVVGADDDVVPRARESDCVREALGLVAVRVVDVGARGFTGSRGHAPDGVADPQRFRRHVLIRRAREEAHLGADALCLAVGFERALLGVQRRTAIAALAGGVGRIDLAARPAFAFGSFQSVLVAVALEARRARSALSLIAAVIETRPAHALRIGEGCQASRYGSDGQKVF